MADKFINESELEEVSGGIGGNVDLSVTMHACRNGKTGELLPIGYGNGGKQRFKCKSCGKEGFVVFHPGTRKLCNLN